MADSTVIEQQQKLNGIEIPREQARALGRALEQQFSSNLPPMLTNADLLQKACLEQNPDWAERVRSNLDAIQKILQNLAMAKKVKAIEHQGGFILEIEPDQQQEKNSNSAAGETVINTALSTAVISGLRHTLGTPLTMTNGFSELYAKRSPDRQVVEYARIINENGESMQKDLDNLPKNGCRIKLVTDSQGNTNMSFLPAESSLSTPQP